MSDIFYTEVDPNLQLELNYRGQTGRYNRTTKDLQFMLEKIANVQIIPYKNPNRTEKILEGVLGGTTVRGGEYLPSGPNGFLTDRTYTVQGQGIEDGKIIKKTAEERTNSSRRIGPYITSLDVSIGDNSNGLLNDATINITVPNPERDLNFIESVYLRPGRAVTIQIAHPDSAIVSYQQTSGLLTSSMASVAKIKELYPTLNQTELREFQKMNSFVFDGMIKSFTIDYQSDMSVNISLSLTGTSQTYADISLIMNTTTPKTQPVTELQLNENKTENFIGPAEAPPPLPSPAIIATPDQITLDQTELGTFYTNLNKEVEETIAFKERGVPRSPDELRGFTDIYDQVSEEIDPGIYWAVWGEPIKNKIAYQRYIQLAWIINFINRQIISKRTVADPFATIICTEYNFLCTSNYYEYMTSADPLRIWLAGSESNPTDLYGDKLWFLQKNSSRDKYVFSETYTSEGIGGPSITETISYPTRIFINMEVIQEICQTLEKNKSFTVASLLSSISSEIYSATGGAIDMQLITHPEKPEYLLFYDAKAISIAKREKPVTPYSVPMFSNHPAGTVVRDFKFSGKLPSDASNLAYVVNSDPSEIAESDIAPYVAYMYAANTVTRSGPHEVVGNLIEPAELEAIQAKYKEAHDKFVEALTQAKIAYGNDITNPEKRAALAQALTKYLQYPKPTIQESNQLLAPVIPFEVEFTIDGINGFRYGDVLTFDGLPTRYKQNTVFSIINITHTVATDGQWTIRSRPHGCMGGLEGGPRECLQQYSPQNDSGSSPPSLP